MVRSLRAGLDEYMDPDLKRRMQAAAVDKAPSNTMQGLGFLLRKAMLGYDMGQDKKQRTAASGALTTGSENQTKIIDAIKAQKAVEARPAMGKVSNQELYEMDAAPGGVNANRELYEQDGGWSNFEDAAPAMAAREASPEIKAQMARIDPNSGALYGRSQALAELLRTNPDNPYAQGALLDNAGQLSNRNANLQLNQLNNQNKLATLANTRAYKAGLLTEKNKYAESEFDRQETKKENLRQTIFKQNQAEDDRKFGRIKTPQQLEQAVTIAKATAGNKPLTQDQAKAGGFAVRMERARGNVEKLTAGPDGKVGTADDYDPTNYQDSAARELPIGGNLAFTTEGRQYEQAKRDWVSANLRKESGAVLGAKEIEDEIAKYFPVFGDDKATVAQKKRSRQAAFAGMKVSSGRAYGEMKKELGDKEGWSIVK